MRNVCVYRSLSIAGQTDGLHRSRKQNEPLSLSLLCLCVDELMSIRLIVNVLRSCTIQ